MVVLAASVITKSGKALVSRQFVEMPRSRIEGLLASFPKLIGSGDQHTFVETDTVRYVYQPLEELFCVLVTNKSSNILQDIDTLHLVARTLSETCRTIEDKEIVSKAFELLSVFDEIVSLGYRENVTLAQIRTIGEMESHEEKVAAEIQRNKEKEAKEELNRKAKAMELQRKQAGRSGVGGGIGGGLGGMGMGMGSFASGFGSSGTTSGGRTQVEPPQVVSSPKTSAKGMQLGRKPQASQLLETLRADEGLQDVASEPTSRPNRSAGAPVVPGEKYVENDTVHISIDEKISAIIKRDRVESIEVKGDVTLRVSDSARSRLRLQIHSGVDDVQFKTHPQVDKQLFTTNNVLALKDPSKPFPVNQALGILRYRFSSKSEDALPLSVNCWPSPTGDGTSEVSIEYELLNSRLELRDVSISIPFPPGGVPTIGEIDGQYVVDKSRRFLEWQIPIVDETSKSGSLEFTVPGEDPNSFFPIKISFGSNRSYCDVDVTVISSVDDGTEVPFSKEVSFEPEEYIIQ
ncbi:clathrin adaptor, mu subunit [Gonapodya prolifera JEL478]|uniref:Coatomer subunit delta n=1 Tax=Gonapodya prolifera (strain JEL478) TaxID=1344416 RepID=A0A139AWB3_GONPJ|nr:clathrin adaptor, mu subunit [Gonapodya prolifera JEL478]|eukprot:KXS20873.1 clathrin adaptor, mu subunit [Gonapodya prolifera JEL478]